MNIRLCFFLGLMNACTSAMWYYSSGSAHWLWMIWAFLSAMYLLEFVNMIETDLKELKELSVNRGSRPT